MHYHELILMLQEKYKIQPYKMGHSSKIMDIKLMEKAIHWNEHTLYVSPTKASNIKPDRPIMLLCTNEPSSLPEGSSYSLMRSEDSAELFRMAKDLIFYDLRMDAALLELAQAALYGNSIVNLINTAATLVENALILVDANMKILAYSTIFEITDPLWAENIERGYCSYEFMQKVRSNKQVKEWRKQDGETQLIQLPGDLQPKLVARLTYGGHFVGSLVMIEHHSPIKRYHHRQLPLIGRMLFERLNHQALGGVHNTILYDLLDKADISDTLKLMSMSKATFPTEMRVVVARFVRPMDNRYLKRAIGMDLDRIFPKGYLVQYKSYIAILVSSISDKQKEELVQLAEHENVSIGISWPFTDIVEFKRHFNQAVASIKQAQRFNKTKHIFDYTEYSYYDLLYNYMGKIPLQHYCHPALKNLHDYDAVNNTQLYFTLKTYLQHNKNLGATAEALFIHRNSLSYRINRIIQLTELDLNNTNTLHSLMDSFRIETFLS